MCMNSLYIFANALNNSMDVNVALQICIWPAIFMIMYLTMDHYEKFLGLQSLSSVEATSDNKFVKHVI